MHELLTLIASTAHRQPGTTLMLLFNLDIKVTNSRLVYILAGFYPSLIRVEHTKELFAKTHGGAIPKEGPPTRLRLFDRVKGTLEVSLMLSSGGGEPLP